jgi:hypothetical protein
MTNYNLERATSIYSVLKAFLAPDCAGIVVGSCKFYASLGLGARLVEGGAAGRPSRLAWLL